MIDHGRGLLPLWALEEGMTFLFRFKYQRT